MGFAVSVAVIIFFAASSLKSISTTLGGGDHGTSHVNKDWSGAKTFTWVWNVGVTGDAAAVTVLGAGALVATITVASAAAAWQTNNLKPETQMQIHYWEAGMKGAGFLTCMLAVLLTLLALPESPVLSFALLAVMGIISWMAAAVVERPRSDLVNEMFLSLARDDLTRIRSDIKDLHRESRPRPQTPRRLRLATFLICVRLLPPERPELCGGYAGGA